MAYGPFATLPEYRAWMRATCLGEDPLFHAIVDTGTGRPSASPPTCGSIRRSASSRSATSTTRPAAAHPRRDGGDVPDDARVFDELGYRRYEWKCDALNEPSRKAAARLGFSFEGVFRQATIYKGRNRDTAWFAIIDHEWPALKAAYEAWLDPGNFDAHGKQQQSLGALTAAALGTPTS